MNIEVIFNLFLVSLVISSIVFLLLEFLRVIMKPKYKVGDVLVVRNNFGELHAVNKKIVKIIILEIKDNNYIVEFRAGELSMQNTYHFRTIDIICEKENNEE